MKTKKNSNKEELNKEISYKEECKVIGEGTKAQEGLNVNISMAQIHGNESFSITGMTIGSSLLLFDLDQFQRRYNVSYPNLNRWIDKLPSKERHKACLSIGKKHFVSEEITKMGKASAQELKRSEILPELYESETKFIDATVPPFVAEGLTNNELIPITGATTNTGMAYYDVDTFAKMHNIHINTVRNYVKKLDEGKLVSAVERFRYRIKMDGKTFVTNRMFFFNKKYRNKLNNLEYAHWLAESKWDVVGTVRFRNLVGRDRAVKIMSGLYQHLNKSFSDFPLNFFFTTEENPGQDGYHNHFVLGSRDNLPMEQIVQVVNKYLEKFSGRYEAKSFLEPFNGQNTFLEYLVKEIGENVEGWDFAFNP